VEASVGLSIPYFQPPSVGQNTNIFRPSQIIFVRWHDASTDEHSPNTLSASLATIAHIGSHLVDCIPPNPVQLDFNDNQRSGFGAKQQINSSRWDGQLPTHQTKPFPNESRIVRNEVFDILLYDFCHFFT
jgi:hypothetical protein